MPTIEDSAHGRSGVNVIVSQPVVCTCHLLVSRPIISQTVSPGVAADFCMICMALGLDILEVGVEVVVKEYEDRQKSSDIRC